MAMMRPLSETPFQEVMRQVVRQSLEPELTKMAEEILKRAYAEIETKVKMRIAEIAITLSQLADIQSLKDRLVISVHFPDGVPK